MSKLDAKSFAAWLAGKDDEIGPYAEFRVTVPMPALAARGPRDDGPVAAACFSPDGTRIVTAHGDGTARLWDGATGQQTAVLRGHQGALRSACFSPDGARILTASTDGTVRLWDAITGAQIAVLGEHDDKAVQTERPRTALAPDPLPLQH